MKKFGILFMMALFAAIGFSSCKETEEKLDNAVAYKIDNNEALTQDDYARIINYVGDYAEKAQKYVDMMINDNYNGEAKAGMDKLSYEYPLLDTFRNCLRQTPAKNLSEDNLQKVAKYAGLVEFSAPLDYTIETNTDKVAGLEEAAPDSVNGVIAGAVDSITVKK